MSERIVTRSILKIVCIVLIIIVVIFSIYNVFYKGKIESYDIEEYDVVTIYYDDTSAYKKGVREDYTTSISSIFDGQYEEEIVGVGSLDINSEPGCYASPSIWGGHSRINIKDKTFFYFQDNQNIADEPDYYGITDGDVMLE